MSVRKYHKSEMRRSLWIVGIGLLAAVLLGFLLQRGQTQQLPAPEQQLPAPEQRRDIPNFFGQDSITLDGNVPGFTPEEIAGMTGEYYSPLDSLGRCGPVWARIDRSLMPAEPRTEIGMIRPSGWHTVTYPEQIADRYLYNRCHLIAFALTGENANECNLITGTRYMNVSGMLPYEKQVLSYLDHSDNHVLYRVTPLFRDSELVARGVEIEALSVEDNGQGISFHVFVYNYQPGIVIDYRTGDSRVGDPLEDF